MVYIIKILSLIALIIGIFDLKLVVWFEDKGRPEVVMLSFSGLIVGLLQPNLVVWIGEKLGY